MNRSQLRPAGSFALISGIKALGYGPPGSGKTPLCNTAPRPVLCHIEPGMVSMKNSNVPTWEAKTPSKIFEFFDWIFKSNEAKEYDTVCVDSLTEMCEVILRHELLSNKHGLKAYGEMASKVYELSRALFDMPEKHVYLICKEAVFNENGNVMKRPSFPGQDLHVKIPYLFDLVFNINKFQVPGVQGTTLAIKTETDYQSICRDRSGKLATYEPPDLTAVFNKAMA